jgi:hypothetical protein
VICSLRLLSVRPVISGFAAQVDKMWLDKNLAAHYAMVRFLSFVLLLEPIPLLPIVYLLPIYNQPHNFLSHLLCLLSPCLSESDDLPFLPPLPKPDQ